MTKNTNNIKLNIDFEEKTNFLENIKIFFGLKKYEPEKVKFNPFTGKFKITLKRK